MLCNVSQAFYPPGFAFMRHSHDYAEFFFIERGRGIHHLAGSSDPLGPGDLVFIHPTTEHALAATGDGPLVFLNITIAPGEFAALARRYASSGADWPWRRTARPTVRHLAGHELDVFLADARALMQPGACGDRLRVEAFLMHVMARARDAQSARADDAPPRIATALARLEDDAELLRGGVAALAERAGCGRAWLSRLVRRHRGISARELVMRTRLDAAARRLRAGDEGIPALADACGFPNLSNFYRLFRRRFHCTPARWRAGHGGGFA